MKNKGGKKKKRDTDKFKEQTIVQTYQDVLKMKLKSKDDDITIERQWENIKNVVTADQVFVGGGFKRSQEWFDGDCRYVSEEKNKYRQNMPQKETKKT